MPYPDGDEAVSARKYKTVSFDAPEDFALLIQKLVKIYNDRNRCKTSERFINDIARGCDKIEQAKMRKKVFGEPELPQDWYEKPDPKDTKH